MVLKKPNQGPTALLQRWGWVVWCSVALDSGEGRWKRVAKIKKEEEPKINDTIQENTKHRDGLCNQYGRVISAAKKTLSTKKVGEEYTNSSLELITH